jgi:uncharacterized protein YjiS (DUF1127 family)
MKAPTCGVENNDNSPPQAEGNMEMAAIEFTRPAPFGAITIFHAVEGVGNIFAALSNWNSARKTRIALSQLSDEVLRDIGLERGDIPRL